MNREYFNLAITLALLLWAGGGCASLTARASAVLSSAIPGIAPTADNPAPPASSIKLIFIHHSTGENWLADWDGGLGIALRDNNYFVSDTNYGWGPDSIGDYTDIGHWWTWFRGPTSATYLSALYAESGQHSTYSRLFSDPGGENEVIMFKSCFPNSYLGGNPNDLPTTGDNPLRGQDAWSEYMTVANAKGIYNDILAYFVTRQDKLFVVITAPPQVANETDATHAANVRAFNNWLVNDWLADYSNNNVAVFDFYNVLTSNGGDANTNDLGWETGNHHRWWNGAVQYIKTVDNDFAAYGSDPWDSHPTAAGGQKASAEFVPLLNVFYHRWMEGEGTPTPTPTGPPPAYHFVYLPLIVKNWSAPVPAPTVTPTTVIPSRLIQPTDLMYEGAFRLPEGPPDMGWEWSGAAMAYYPDGDLDGPADGCPGSIFGTGHDWYQYVSEISIPIPVNPPSKDVNELNTATTLQDFQDIRGNLFPEFEIPRAGLEYLPPQGEQITGKLYFCWAQHMGEGETNPSHGWCELDLSNPQTAGAWRIGDYWNYVTTDCIFAIAQAWANANTPGMYLVTGRFRDGGQGGQGPSLFAYGPWNEGNPPAPGSTLSAIPLLLYGNVYTPDSPIMDNYHHSDEWSGGAWLTTVSGKSAVIFVGTKGTGDCWYGCSDGTVWPDEPPYPPDCPERGWWSTGFEGQIIFYDPADLAAVVRGQMETWEPQPYATLNIDEYLYHVESSQQKHHLGAASFDREQGLLYVFEPLADGDKSLIHVWRIEG